MNNWLEVELPDWSEVEAHRAEIERQRLEILSYAPIGAVMFNNAAVNRCANWIELVGGDLDGDSVYCYRYGNMIAIWYGSNTQDYALVEVQPMLYDDTEFAYKVESPAILEPYIDSIMAIVDLPEEYIA